MPGFQENFASKFGRLARVPPNTPAVVAVSGGLDSVVLLHLMRFGLDSPLDLHVAHFDHAMRADSARDADWVRGLAMAWQLPFHTARGASLRSEADARRARYDFLDRTADQIGAPLIAVGHQADDQIETVLFRMLRGTGVDGLSAIPARRGRIVRPLLAFMRGELAAYAAAHGLGYRDDPSNFSRAYTRNRIRHDLLPQLDREWPGSKSALLALAESAADARRGWNSVLAEIEKRVVRVEDTAVIELARQPLLEYHPEVRARLIRRLLARLGATPGRAGTAAAAAFIKSGGSGSAIQLSRARVERAFDTIRLVSIGTDAPHLIDQPLTIENAQPGSGTTVLGGERFDVEWTVAGAGGADSAYGFELDALRFPLTVRAWRPGDRIQLQYGSKKLKKLFAEKRLARQRRNAVPVVVDANDNILCVVGLARAANPAPRGGQVLQITVNNGQSG